VSTFALEESLLLLLLLLLLLSDAKGKTIEDEVPIAPKCL